MPPDATPDALEAIADVLLALARRRLLEAIAAGPGGPASPHDDEPPPAASCTDDRGQEIGNDREGS
jgi:hypothetical protein